MGKYDADIKALSDGDNNDKRTQVLYVIANELVELNKLLRAYIKLTDKAMNDRISREFGL